MALLAITVNVYSTPFVRPDTVANGTEPGTDVVKDPGDDVTV
jgi:hypothetical protein